MRVLVTGASGFLGSHLVDRFLAGGAQVSTLLRKHSRQEYLPDRGVTRCYGSMEDTESLRRALENIDVVVHCAGVTKARREQDFFAINTTASQTLAELSIQAGVRKFLYISSLAAHGPSDTPRGEEETAAPVSAYGRSKLEAEQRLLALKDGIQINILRPPIIYGSRFLDFLPLFQAAQRGLVFVPTDGKGKLSAIGAKDCAEASYQLVVTNTQNGSIFSLSDGQIYSMRELGELAATALQKKVWYIEVPMFFLQAAASTSTLLGHLTRTTPFFNNDKLQEIRARNWVCGHEALTKATGWRPNQTLDDGMKEMLDWYRTQKLL